MISPRQKPNWVIDEAILQSLDAQQFLTQAINREKIKLPVRDVSAALVVLDAICDYKRGYYVVNDKHTEKESVSVVLSPETK